MQLKVAVDIQELQLDYKQQDELWALKEES